MNSVVLIGRLTKDPDVRASAGGMQIARYTLAVDRTKKGETDFINCIAFDKGAEFAEKWLSKGMKIAIKGHIQTGSYKDKEGRTVYTTDVVVDAHEFVDSKKEESKEAPKKDDGFMAIPDGVEDVGLPFS